MAGPATPSALYKMISIPEAQQIVLAETRPLSPVTTTLGNAHGHILAEDVIARDPLPPFAASIKDGYAVVASDGVGEFDVVYQAHAGAALGSISPGTVAYVATGAQLPQGSDAVVQIENTQQLPPKADGTPRVKILQAAAGPGDDVRPLGSDIQAGQVVLAAGDRLGAPEIGILATVGAVQIQVHGTPHVAVLSTGDEVVDPATAQLSGSQIRDANRAMLLAAAAEAGAATTDLGIARDIVGSVEAAVVRALELRADVLLTSGGVSMGDKDFVKPILERAGRVFFGKVCMKPGKPLTFATVDVEGGQDGKGAHRMLIFGLPGNPVSSIVTFNLVVLPALRKLAGWREPGLRRVHVRTTSALKMDPVRPEYHRATLHWARVEGAPEGSVGGEWVAESTGGQISSRLLSMRTANALLEIPQASGVIPAGTVVSALLIADLAEMPIPEEPAITAV